jgi:hypothetical protein
VETSPGVYEPGPDAGKTAEQLRAEADALTRHANARLY